MEITTPQLLYHGTTEACLNGFQCRLLNREFWRAGRDFGEGFYTTISPAQARKWAHKGADGSVTITRPCVLSIELISIPPEVTPLVFLSESENWARFIFEHRKETRSGHDPCQRHPELIVGPMADNDTGKIIRDAVQWRKDAAWFYSQITRTAKGRKLDVLHLGNQVVFASERWETSLRLIGFYLFSGGRWIYHENARQAELL